MGHAIVVDACIARAAGESDDPTARVCRETLDGVRENDHRLAMSVPLRDEWFKPRTEHPWSVYASRYALTWFTDMTTRRRVDWVQISGAGGLRKQVLRAARENEREQMEKDVHLVETALASDRRILSTDRRAHKCYRRVAAEVEQVAAVLWLDPYHDSAPGWLRRGAPDRRAYRLGCPPQSSPLASGRAP